MRASMTLTGESDCVFIENRKIRSAGRTTGSVELTLPTEFLAFNGHNSRVSLIEGNPPCLMIVPEVAPVAMTLSKLCTCIAASFGVAPIVISDNEIQFVAGRSSYDGSLRVGLKECGMLVSGKFSTRNMADAGTLIATLSQMVLTKSHTLKDEDDISFVGKATVYVVFGDSNQLDLFEIDTIHNALPHFSPRAGRIGGDFANRSIWEASRAHLQSLLQFVVALRDEAGSVGASRTHWARAERIASKVL